MKRELTDYQFPDDLKTMKEEDLNVLAFQIREFLIEKVSRTGGHLASNLGIVELTIALHRAFDTPKDKLIWDVGHQSYVHKILTGRADRFDTLRQTGGLSGFPKSNESPHDMYDTGHSSTSLSAGIGMARARDLKGESHHVVSVIGDGSMTGGLAYEALNNIGASKTRLIIVLNDNGMSIAKNIGGMSQHLGKLRTSSSYRQAKIKIRRHLNKLPGKSGETIAEMLSAAKSWVKYALVWEGVLFEELGITYLGPVDGHNIRQIEEALSQAKRVDGPVIVHVITKKGKGYRPAETNPNKFHGVAPFDPATGELLKKPGTGWSRVMGEEAVRLAQKDPRITAITAAMGNATGLAPFAAKYPDRFFDVGIAEAHAVTFAAGLAKGGMRPLVAIYSSFLQRAFDQIVEDVCLQDLPVVFAIDRAGIVGADGETHHGIFDIAYLRMIPNMSLFAPSDGNELEAMLDYAFSLGHPAAVRYPRGECAYDPDWRASYSGGNERVHEGQDAEIWAVGSSVHTALSASDLLEEKGYSVGVVKVNQIVPLDVSLLDSSPDELFSLEDGIVTGGFGEMLAAETGRTVTKFGWPKEFIPQGSPQELREIYRLDARGIAERIGERIERKA